MSRTVLLRHRAHPLRRPRDRQPARLSLVRRRPRRARQADGATTCASRCATGTRSVGRASTCSAARPSTARGSAPATRWQLARAQGRGRVRVLRQARRAVLHLPRSRRRAGRRDAGGDQRALDRIVERLAGAHGSAPACSCCGARPICSAIRATPPARRPIPDPEVFAYAAAQVKQAMDVTHRLGGANYVLWGGREGYDTLLNTDLRRERAQLGRFMQLVVEHKHEDRLPRHAAHRAQADGADQAPVRPRRRRRARLPARSSASSARSSSTSRPTTPRSPATASSTSSPTRSPTISSAASTPTAAIRRTAGTPTSFPTAPTS